MAGNGIQEKVLRQVDKNFSAETEFLSHLVKLENLVGLEQTTTESMNTWNFRPS